MEYQDIGGYKLVRKIGEGGMASVYLAHDTKLLRDVAIKIIKANTFSATNALTQFTQEARLIVKLEHPHILPVYDYDMQHDPPYIVMRYLNVGTLDDVLSRQTISMGAVAKIFGQLSAALDYAHRKGVIHRDIKPSNILIDDDGNAFVTDFGLAYMSSIGSSEAELDEGFDNQIVGTPPYIAPEYIRGVANPDHRADIYSLGIMLYEVLTGQVAFSGSITEILFKHLNENPPNLSDKRPDLPLALDIVIQQCLSKDPVDRYPTVSDFAGAMASAFGRLNTEKPINIASLLEARTLPLTIPQKQVRIFLINTLDTTDERAIARRIIEQLATASFLNGRLAFEIVEWVADASQASPKLYEPDEAKKHHLPSPADCEIAIFLLGSQWGATLPTTYIKNSEFRYGIDGGHYKSLVEWLYINVLEHRGDEIATKVAVYHHNSAPAILMDDEQFEAKRRQWQEMTLFIDALVIPNHGDMLRYAPYTSTLEFEEHFKQQLRMFVAQILFEAQERGEIGSSQMETPTYSNKPSVPIWQGSPFPGLRPFGIEDASIFFGRGVEIENLIQLLSNPQKHFIALVGASGAGKSSLVDAGLLPRLKNNAIEGSKDWLVVRFTPDMSGTGNVFQTLATALAEEPLNIKQANLAELLAQNPQALPALCKSTLAKRPTWAECLFYIDQFEELFTRNNDVDQAQFIQIMEILAATPRFRILVTMRADFYAQSVENPQLASLIRNSTFPVSNPTRDMLRQMIESPAERANLRFEPGLIRLLLDDTGNDVGSLALLAFALFQLYEGRNEKGMLTFESYQKFGGVRGAIGQHAERVFKRLSEEAKAHRNAVFRHLVTVDERGVPTRQRVSLALVSDTAPKKELVEAFIDARLLVTTRGEGNQALLEVAHEALFRSWPALADWIHDVSDDLRIGSEILRQAETWQRSEKDSAYLLQGSRLQVARDWLQQAQNHELVGDLQKQYILASEERENNRRVRELNRMRFTAIGLGILFVIIIGALSYIVSNGFNNIEMELIQANINLVNAVVDNEIGSLTQVMGNWSVWDDTYNFVHGEDDTYQDYNLVEDVFANLNINTMLFYNEQPELYHRQTYDIPSNSFVSNEDESLSAQLASHINNNNFLISHPDEFSTFEGIVNVDNSLVIAVSQPILRVDLSGFPGGTLVWGRTIDADLISSIAERTQLNIGIEALDGVLSADFSQAYEYLKTGTQTVYTAPLKDCEILGTVKSECVAGYTLRADIYGNPALVMRVAFPRTVVAQGQNTTRIAIGVLLVLGIGFTVLVVFAFTRFSEQ